MFLHYLVKPEMLLDRAPATTELSEKFQNFLRNDSMLLNISKLVTAKTSGKMS